jgi:hypothetical protein
VIAQFLNRRACFGRNRKKITAQMLCRAMAKRAVQRILYYVVELMFFIELPGLLDLRD